ncbi:MAG: C45 family peptidase [bacterium]
MRRSKTKKIFLWSSAIFLSLILLLVILFCFLTRITPPVPSDLAADSLVVSTPGPGIKTIGNSWLKQNDHGLWEMYISGKPYERGVIIGKLSEELIRSQEKAFINEISKRVPSGFYRHFLRYFIYWFNRDLEKFIPEEYKLEILGISKSADPQFSFIGDNYRRLLNYHSAHDIGHTIQDFRLVGCSSFGAWDELSSDSSLIIGRNFDFYMGDEFAENKIVCFEKPDSGYGFMIVTWGGMIGTLSGMNEKGLTVTINAAKSEIPFSARTPISLLAREILQYAGTIGEAYAIAQNRQTFVSESILIGSGNENRAAIIEKSPFGISLFNPQETILSVQITFSHTFSRMIR